MKKEVIKRSSTQPSSHQYQATPSSLSHSVSPPARIVGVSKTGFFIVFLGLLLSFNYLLFSKLERLEGSVASLERMTRVTQVATLQATNQSKRDNFPLFFMSPSIVFNYRPIKSIDFIQILKYRKLVKEINVKPIKRRKHGNNY